MQIPDQETVDIALDWLIYLKQLILVSSGGSFDARGRPALSKEIETAIKEVNSFWPCVKYNPLHPHRNMLFQIEAQIKFFEVLSGHTENS